MKRFPLLPLVALVLAVAYACTDATAPPHSHALLVPKDLALALGNPPPPPVDAAVVICAGGACVVVNGVYNAEGGVPAAAATAFATAFATAAEEDEIDDPGKGTGVCTFPGKASLKFDHSGNQSEQGDDFDKKQRRGFAVSTKNARIKCKDLVASGKGTIEYQVGGRQVVVMLEEVLTFDNQPHCASTGLPQPFQIGFCAEFTAKATVNGVATVATGDAFERTYYDHVCPVPQLEEGFCIPSHGG